MFEALKTGLRQTWDLQLVESAANEPRDIEPGDVIVAKTLSNPLSRLIGDLDGWWCHTAIAIGDDRIAHASGAGVSSLSLDELKENYEAGVGVARPALDLVSRQRAAQWARDSLSAGLEYGAEDLGTAFSLLWRAANQPSAAELYDEVFKQESFAGPGDWRNTDESTCSGFAYRAYAEGAQAPLIIEPAPGVRLQDGMLYAPDHGELVGEAEEQLGSAAPQESLGGKFRLGKIGLTASARAIKALLLDEPVPLAAGVTPADMWMSPSHASRWFLEGAEVAVEAAQGAPSGD